jgi:hypothetical protein
MNRYTQREAQLELQTQAETPSTEAAPHPTGFTAEEGASLLWLRQWYQRGGSDFLGSKTARRLEFLRFLVESGAIAL